jgi:hypothetical protein
MVLKSRTPEKKRMRLSARVVFLCELRRANLEGDRNGGAVARKEIGE